MAKQAAAKGRAKQPAAKAPAASSKAAAASGSASSKAAAKSSASAAAKSSKAAPAAKTKSNADDEAGDADAEEADFDAEEFLASCRNSFSHKVELVTKAGESLAVASCLEIAEEDQASSTQHLAIPTLDEMKDYYRLDGSNCDHEIAHIDDGATGFKDYLVTLSVVPPFVHAGDFLQLLLRCCAKKKVRPLYAFCRAELGPDTLRRHFHAGYSAFQNHRWKHLKKSIQKELKRLHKDLHAKGPADKYEPNFKSVPFEVACAYAQQPGPKKPSCLFGEMYQYTDPGCIKRSLESFAASQNKIALKGMQRPEFCETVIHLNLTTYQQVRAFVDGASETAKRMREYLISGTACIEGKIREGLKWNKGGKESGDANKSLMDLLVATCEEAEASGAAPCDCGYYEFYARVFENNGYPNFKRTFAKHCIEGRGNRYCVLIVIGEGGVGKTHFVIKPMRKLLGDKAFGIPMGKGSHLLKGVLDRMICALIWDEVLLQRVKLLFTDQDGEGWFKCFLEMCTADSFEVPVPQNTQKYECNLFSNPAPTIATTTRKLYIDDEIDAAIKEDDIASEQQQLEERITYIHLTKKILAELANEDGTGPWADVHPVKVCYECFSRLMRDGRDAYICQQAEEKEQMLAKRKKWAEARAGAAAVKEEPKDTVVKNEPGSGKIKNSILAHAENPNHGSSSGRAAAAPVDASDSDSE
eukprot:g16333.t1